MTTEPIPALDDAVRMQAIDKRNMLRLINELPEQCETALGIARSFAVEPAETGPSSVFITGVGDSGIAADMAAAALADVAEVPVISDHGGRLPKHVGEGSLVFIVDYTGKSQIGMRNLRDAKHRGAQVVCIATGGKLLESANKEEVRAIKIPPGQPGRSAIGYLLVPIIATIEKFGIAQGQIEQISHGIKLMKNVREMLRFETPTARNSAKQTAEALFDRVVGIYGAPGYRMAVADRWKSQIAANSKALAFSGSLHALALGGVSGWETAGKRADELAIVLLRDPVDKGEIVELADAGAEVLKDFRVVQVSMRGATIIEKLFYGVYLGDYVSYYLALLAEVNPSITENIALVESMLAEQAEPPAPVEQPEQTETGGE